LSISDFSSLNLKNSLLDNLKTLDYQSMTPIQSQTLPHMINGKDIIAQGKTGSGKTAAFGLGILQRLEVKRFRIQSLVLCPTRELADQVATEIRKLGRGIHNIKVLTICGGMSFGPQVGSLEHGAHIIVGTPGRVEEHLRKGTLKLDDLNCLVLDEADRMLDMGFQESLDNIISYMPSQRQTLLFSATFPEKIQAIAQRIMHLPEVVKVESTHNEQSILQLFYKLEGDISRLDALRLLLLHHQPESAVVFCNTKQETQEVADALRAYKFGAVAMHGDLEQKERDQTLVRFSNKSASILVATDVAARGLDIETLDAVINYHLPRDLEVHTHRIGRTGRAGHKGIACTLYAEKELYKLEKLAEYLQQKIETTPLPPKSILSQVAFEPIMATLQIDGGKKQKVRPGDILGALTGKQGVDGSEVGKIQVFDNKAYVAVNRTVTKVALKKLTEGKLKGKTFKVRLLPRY
jgi:ATP-independent RNA helicase DbpA